MTTYSWSNAHLIEREKQVFFQIADLKSMYLKCQPFTEAVLLPTLALKQGKKAALPHSFVGDLFDRIIFNPPKACLLPVQRGNNGNRPTVLLE